MPECKFSELGNDAQAVLKATISTWLDETAAGQDILRDVGRKQGIKSIINLVELEYFKCVIEDWHGDNFKFSIEPNWDKLGGQ